MSCILHNYYVSPIRFFSYLNEAHHLPFKGCEYNSGILYTIWQVIANFHGKSENALKINFCGFKLRDSNQSWGIALHKQ